jgi:DNA-binding transcriptional ArsR family regulator
MNRLLPRKPAVERQDQEPQVVSLDDQGTESVFSVLSTTMARAVLTELYGRPSTPSEVAERVDTSIQNVTYHLDNLVEAGLVEVVDQWYSEKGREMDVYAPANDPLVLVAGDPDADGVARSFADCPAEEATPRPAD